jgi:uncharacterized membrane protein
VRRNQVDLLAVSGVAVLAVIVSVLSGGRPNALVVGLSLPFVLFLPGYSFSAALLPDGRAGLAERIAMSMGLSIAIAALGGLLLNVLPSGLTAASWRFLFLGVTLTGAAFAAWRRTHGCTSGPGPLVDKISIREAVLLSSAALLIGLALGLGALGMDPTDPARNDAPFTQFWAVPAPSGEQSIVHIGLHNYENERVTYFVTLEAGGRVLAEWPEVTLENGSDWRAQAALPRHFASQEITANAYRAGETDPYRHVRVIPSAAGSP